MKLHRKQNGAGFVSGFQYTNIDLLGRLGCDKCVKQRKISRISPHEIIYVIVLCFKRSDYHKCHHFKVAFLLLQKSGNRERPTNSDGQSSRIVSVTCYSIALLEFRCNGELIMIVKYSRPVYGQHSG